MQDDKKGPRVKDTVPCQDCVSHSPFQGEKHAHCQPGHVDTAAHGCAFGRSASVAFAGS